MKVGVAVKVGVGVRVGVAVGVTVGVKVKVGVGVLVNVGVGVRVGVAVGVDVGVKVKVGVAATPFASKAPMQQLTAPVPGRTKPRWSRLSTGAVPVVVEHTLSSPALIPGLAPVHPARGAPVPVQRATVCVGPPLFWSPAGSRTGFVLQNEVPVVVAQLAPAKPHVQPSSILWPPSVTPPAQLPPEVLLATIVLATVTVPE